MDIKLKKFLRGTMLETRLEITHSILAKNIAAFCPGLKNIYEYQLRSSRLICLKEVSRQPNIDSVIWLLVITLMQVYNM